MSNEIDELVAEAKSGDHRAFEELVRHTYSDTYTLAFRLTGDEEDARDVVQEAYLRVTQRSASLPRRRAVQHVAASHHGKLREHSSGTSKPTSP